MASIYFALMANGVIVSPWWRSTLQTTKNRECLHQFCLDIVQSALFLRSNPLRGYTVSNKLGMNLGKNSKPHDCATCTNIHATGPPYRFGVIMINCHCP